MINLTVLNHFIIGRCRCKGKPPQDICKFPMNSRYGFDHLGSLGGGAPPPPAALGCGAGRRGGRLPHPLRGSPLKRGPWGGCFAGAAGGGLGGAAPLEGLPEISRPTGSLAAGMRIPCGASRSGKALISWRNRPGGRRPPRRPPGSHRRSRWRSHSGRNNPPADCVLPPACRCSRRSGSGNPHR